MECSDLICSKLWNGWIFWVDLIDRMGKFYCFISPAMCLAHATKFFVGMVYIYIYIYIYTIVRRQIKGAAGGHIWHIHLLLRPQGVYCWVRGVYFARSILRVYILAISGWVSVYSRTTKKFATAAHRNEKLVFAMERLFPPTHGWTDATASKICHCV